MMCLKQMLNNVVGKRIVKKEWSEGLSYFRWVTILYVTDTLTCQEMDNAVDLSLEAAYECQTKEGRLPSVQTAASY